MTYSGDSVGTGNTILKALVVIAMVVVSYWAVTGGYDAVPVPATTTTSTSTTTTIPATTSTTAATTTTTSTTIPEEENGEEDGDDGE